MRQANYAVYKQLRNNIKLAEAYRKAMHNKDNFWRDVSGETFWTIKTLDGYRYLEYTLGENAARTHVHGYQNILSEIRQQRHFLSQCNYGGAIRDAEEASRDNACLMVARTFPSLHWMSRVEKSVGFELKTSYYGNNYVNVKLTWDRKVYQKGIASVKAGDGMRFILDAEERHLSRLNDQGIRAFSCPAIKVKHKKISMENTWVMMYERNDGEGHITCANTEFPRAESLINRRIKSEIEGLLFD